MSRNRIKIVSDEKENKIFFYSQNERMEWNLVPNESKLSRKKYVQSNLKENLDEILSEIISVYNPGKRGIELFFEGTVQEYELLNKIISEKYQDTLFLHKNSSSIAVAGKICSGKSTFIEQMINLFGEECKIINREKIIEYFDIKNNATWYELPSIDLKKEDIIDTISRFNHLAKKGVNKFIYCIDTNKIEKLEEFLITSIGEKNKEIKILILLTRCLSIEDAQEFKKYLNECFEDIKVIPILAKDFNTRVGTVKSYGLKEVFDFLF